MKAGERVVRLWRNPVYDKIEVILVTPLGEAGEAGEDIGAVANIEDGQFKWFPDINFRLKAKSITREDIIEDVAAIAADRAPRLPG